MRKTAFRSNLTSDYSSEDGESEVTSTIAQNERNQFLEEEEKVNGRGGINISALEVYREAGEYWK